MRPRLVRGVIAATLGFIAVAGPSASAGILPNGYQEKVTVMSADTIGTESGDVGETIRGGCFFVTIRMPLLTNGVNEGIIGEASVSTEDANTLETATVSCRIRVDGVDAPGTRLVAFGPEVQTNIQQIVFDAGDTDFVELCEHVVFDSGVTLPDNCVAATELTVPPQVVLDAVGALAPTIDPLVCPELAELGSLTGGGVAGVLQIRPDGDVYAANPFGEPGLDPIYDCPPYYDF